MTQQGHAAFGVHASTALATATGHWPAEHLHHAVEAQQQPENHHDHRCHACTSGENQAREATTAATGHLVLLAQPVFSRLGRILCGNTDLQWG
jgi:hypothetical protein